MGIKEELEEKEEACDSTETYVELAKEVVEKLSDKEWAARLIDEGADWAEYADDFMLLAGATSEALDDKAKAKAFLIQGKDYCTNIQEFMNLAKAAKDTGDIETAKELCSAAQGKCVKIKDFLDLSKNVLEMLSNADLAKEISD